MSVPITVTATAQDPSGTALTGGCFVRFRLRNFSGYVPQISGTSILPEIQVDAIPVNGLISQSLWPNNAITPSTTFYTVELWSVGRITSSGNYIFNANTNLNSASQVNTPPVPAGFSLVLENNSALNSSQQTLNLVNTDGSVTITDLGAGAIQLNSGGGFSTSGAGGFWSAGLPLTTPYITTFNESAPATTKNQVAVFQFTLASKWTISNVAIYVGTGISGGSVNVGLYDSSGNKLSDSGALAATGSAVIVSTAMPLVLLPGTYYFAQSATATGTINSMQVLSLNQSGSTTPISVENNSGTVKVGLAANATSGGVLPGTLGTLTAGTTLAMTAAFFGV